MPSCSNCFNFVVKGRFCDECKFILIDGRHIICKLCKSPKNARTTKENVCLDCLGNYSRAICEYCEITQYVKNGSISCDTCSESLCIYCTTNDTNDTSSIFPSKLFGDVICESCSETHNDVMCDHLHDTCGNTKHICCVCKDLRPYKKNWKSYSGYVDMIGNVDTLTRWYHYCPHCKSACENICSNLDRFKT